MKIIKMPTRLALIVVAAFFVYTQASAQSHDMRQNIQGMKHSGMQVMNQQQMQMNMDQMMKHMNEMVAHTDKMLKSQHEEQEHKMQGASSATVQNKMTDMGMSINKMTKNMQKTMEQMQKMLSDEEIMNDPAQKTSMENMHKNMGDMLVAMDGMIQNLDELKPQKGKKE